MARLYEDSWAVQAVTGDLVVNKYLSSVMLLTLRGHYHLQSGASFYRNAEEYRILGPAGQYWTGDRELSPMSNYLVGGRMAFLRRPQQERSSWFAEMEADVKYELLVYHARVGVRPQPRSPLRPHPARVVFSPVLAAKLGSVQAIALTFSDESA